MITQERLKELLEYDPETGIFIWIKRTSNRVKVGDIAGVPSHGYVRISVDGKTYAAHRLAFLYMIGKFPKHEGDHENTVRNDNRWENLRDLPHSVNVQNIRAPHSDSKNLLGVQPRSGGKFSAKICFKGSQRYIGVFETAELAHAAYVDAKRDLHEGCTL